MKTVQIKSMALTNFRGHKSTNIDFSDLTIISGDNGTGKSTVFDAFVWLLFGKDQFDRKDFEIIPTVNGKMQERVDAEVEAVINFDGREIILKRTLHQKWVRRRGTAEEVFDGCETLYQWDGVDIKAGDYKARVDLMVEETIFKLITKPDAFLNLHWTKQREFLFQMAGSLTDQQIAASDPKFAQLLDLVNGKSLAEFKKEIAAKKKKAKTELDDIQPRIDQTTRLMPENKDFAAIEREIKSIDNEITVIDGMIADRSKAIRGQYEAIQEKQKEINSLESKQLQVVNDKQLQNNQDAFKKNQERNNLQNEWNTIKSNLKAAETEMQDGKNGIEALQRKKLAKEKELEQLRAEWEKVNESEYKAQEGCLICPVFNTACGDSFAVGKHAESQEKAKSAFIASKDKKLDELDEQGIKLNDEIKFIESRIKDGETYYNQAKRKAETLNNQYNEIGHKLGLMQEVTPEPVIAEELPEWQELAQQIAAIKETIQDVQPVDNSELNTNKAELNAKRDELKKDLSDRDLIARYTKEIEDLKTRAKELAQQIADLEGQEFTIDAFNKVKIDECDRRINGMFSLVKFKLFDTTLDGNEFEACIPTNKQGVPYIVTNTAEQINMGLDIVRVISQFYNVAAPVFLDRCESINEPISTGSQMILIKVTAPGTPFQVK
jgi:DNA repair exonuclease SbcCD ATPase subunit